MAQATVPLRRTTGFELRWPGIITALVIVGVVAGALGFFVRDRQAPPVNPDQAIADQMVGLFATGSTGAAADQLYTTTVVLHDNIGGVEMNGLAEVKADAIEKIAVGFKLTNVTAPVRTGQVASWFMKYQIPNMAAETFLMVVRFSGDKIAEQWVYPIS